MRPRRCSAVALALALVAFAPRAVAQGGGPEQGGALFLLLPVGARATALGQAAAADAGSSEAVFWNPAGLGTLVHSEFAVHYATTFASRNTAISGEFVDNRLGTLGITGYLVDLGTQPALSPSGVTTGQFAAKYIELLASYATEVASTIAVGVNYKLIQFRNDCQGDCGPLRSTTGTTHAVDVGAQIGLGRTDALRIGIALRNAGFKLQLINRDQADPLPTRLALGLAYRLPFPQASATNPVGARVLLDLQDKWGEYGSPDARMGVEVDYASILQVRAGYAFLEGETGGPSVGIGVQLDRVAFDLARIFYESSGFEDPFHLSLRVRL